MIPPLDLSADAVGCWLQLPGSLTAELMGSVGFDVVCIDQQHGLIGDDALVPMLQAVDATGVPALVRVTADDHAAIGRALDRGAAGVIVPLVDSAAEAAAAVAACHYPPRGNRSFGPLRAGWREARPAPVCLVMIETMAAVAALPEILAVEGLDGIFIGPSDLSLSAGLDPTVAQAGDPGFDALLRSVVEPARERGLPVGIYAASAEHALRFRAAGITFSALFAEAAMLRAAAAEHLARARGR